MRVSCFCLSVLVLVQHLPAGNAFAVPMPALKRCTHSIRKSFSFAPVRHLTELRSGNSNKNSGDDTFSDRHVDKRGVTGRFSVFAEGLDVEEMTASEFRDALKEKMLERRRSSSGNKAAQDYMYVFLCIDHFDFLTYDL